MPQLGFKFKTAKAGFFDPKGIIKGLDRATGKVFSKFGAFVRTRAKSSIRKRKKSAEQDKPPSSHQGMLRRLIFFFYDRAAQGLVIGPTLFNGGEDRDALEMLEHGGATLRRFVVIKGGKKGQRNQKDQIRFSKSAPRQPVNYQGNPFMQPALEEELPGLPGMWADSVK